MADQDNFRTQDNYKTYVRETRTSESSSGGMALIVGGLVVAVGFILWLVFGAVTPSSVPAGGDTNVTIEPPAASSDTDVIVDPAPAAPATDAAPDAAAPDAATPDTTAPDAAAPDAAAPDATAPAEPAPAD